MSRKVQPLTALTPIIKNVLGTFLRGTVASQIHLLPTARKIMFSETCVSHSVHRGGVSHLDREPPLDRDPPDRDLLDRDSPPPAATASVDTHPTGIHSCFQFTTHSTKNNITAIITVILSTVGVEKPIEGNENINDLFIPSKYRSESDKDQRTNRKDKK